jgi:predicted dehydrogenase
LKIVLIGPGSIGQRHIRNILELDYTDISVVSRSAVLPAEFASLPVFTSIEQALEKSSFDAGIICTPTSSHSSAIIALLKARIPNIYIEKPVSDSLDKIADIIALSKTYTNNIVVGFDLHFDRGLQKVKELLSEAVIGKVVSINAQVGQYLPDWRPHEDYRNGMSAKKITGGGVMLDLVHEFDYLLWLIGSVKNVACQNTNTGALEIETEDVCDVLLRFDNNATGTIHLDYLQQKLVRNCLITGFNGSIQWNLAESKVSWIDGFKKEYEFNYKGFERNERFKEIIKAFLENKGDIRLTDLTKGIESLKLVVAAKESAEKNIFVEMATFKN